MKITTRTLWYVALLIASISLASNASAQTAPARTDASNAQSQETARAQSVVKGRAIFEDTEAPASRERVQLVATQALADPFGPLRIPTSITNDDGEFVFRHIAAGEYYIITQPVDEHLSSAQSFLVPRPTGDAVVDAAKLEEFKKEHIKIAIDGQNSIEISLRVRNPHFGTISGQVVDFEGKPAIKATVHLMRREKRFGVSTHTDEKGEYKFWGLSAGDYLISASPAPKTRDGENPAREFQGLLAATYFPSTLDESSSAPVIVLADRETRDINITLLARGFHGIAGTVRMRSNGRPVTNALLRLSQKDVRDQSSGFCRTDERGRWSFSNLPDGIYSMLVEPRADQQPNETNERFAWKKQDVTLSGADIEDLVIEVSEGGRISGVVTVDGKLLPQFISVSSGNSSATVAPDGTFILEGVSDGDAMLSASALPEYRFYVKSIELNGVDLLREQLKIGDGDQVKDVHIVISSGVGIVNGRVFSSLGGKPLSGMQVLLHRVSPEKRRQEGGQLTALTDEEGNFSLSGPPGEYAIIAWNPSEGPSAFRDAMSKALQGQASRVTLLPGDHKKVDLKTR